MTRNEAKESLMFHAFSHPDSVNNPRAKHGFLGSLRPYRGTLNPDNFHSVMKALRVLAPELSTDKNVDREVVSALWGICHCALAWGVHPDGMLRRNDLIKDADAQRLADWMQEISNATMFLLEGSDFATAFDGYDENSS